MNENKSCKDCRWCIDEHQSARYSFLSSMKDNIHSSVHICCAECHYHSANSYEYITDDHTTIHSPFPLIDENDCACSCFTSKLEHN